MGFTAFKLVAIGVVHRMAALPAEVGHQQQAVQREAHRRLQASIGMEGAMAAFVGQHPAAHRHRARDQPIEQPERRSRRRERDAGAEAVGQQREPKGEGQAAPCLGRLVLEQVGGKARQQFGLAGVGAVRCGCGRWGRLLQKFGTAQRVGGRARGRTGGRRRIGRCQRDLRDRSAAAARRDSSPSIRKPPAPNPGLGCPSPLDGPPCPSSESMLTFWGAWIETRIVALDNLGRREEAQQLLEACNT
jgi:hypothetical protein